MELRRTVRIVNDQGLHARPCHSIVSAAQEYQSELRIKSGGRVVNGKSIIELMTLGAGLGSELELCASGRDAAALLSALEQLFAEGFGEG